jgi:integral membrane protein (TIGR01906 family)
MTPHRAGWPSLLLFGLAVAAVILLTGPLLLFFPPVVSFEQARHDVPALLGTDQATVDRATASMLGDLLRNGDFTVSISPSGEPVLDAKERSHMRDVGGVVRGLMLAGIVAWLLAIGLWWWLRRDRDARARAMLAAALAIGVAALVLGAFFALAFDAAFAAFHAIFFAAGTWTFGPDSNLLRFFPEPLWFELALLAGATIVVTALLVGWAATRTLSREPTGLR